MLRNWNGGNLAIPTLNPFSSAPATPTGPNGTVASSQAPFNSAVSPPGNSRSIKEPDDGALDEDFPLPFSAAAAAHKETAYKDAYVSPNLGSVAAFAPPAHQLIFSPPGRAASNRDSVASTASVETKDDFLLELLSGQALVEAQDFEILPWDAVDQLKSVRTFDVAAQCSTKLNVWQEHKDVVDKISRLTDRLASETRMRDAALSLKKQDAARSVLRHPGLERSNSVASMDDRISSANARVETLSADLYSLKHREITIRTRLLRHIAAVLAATVRRRDHISQPDSKRSSILGGKRSMGSRPASRILLQSPIRTNGMPAQFDGAHFFAGNRSAVPPASRNSPRSASVDPAMYAGMQAEIAEKTAESEKLRDDIARLTADLSSAQSAVEASDRRVQSAQLDAEAQRSAMDQMSKRTELRAQNDRGALVSALSRHRSSVSPLAGSVPSMGTTDDAAAVFDAFFQQATHYVHTQFSSRDAQASELITLKSEVDRQTKRATEAESSITRAQSTLRDLWDALPPAPTIDIATAAAPALASSFATATLPGLRRGLGIGTDDTGFSNEALVDRAKTLTSNAKTLSNRVVREATDASTVKQENDKLQKALQAAQETATQARAQLKDLEARAAAAASQEVASLERINEMQAGFEQIRLDKSRAEKERDQQAERTRSALAEKDQIASQMHDLQREIENARSSSKPLQAAKEQLEQETEDLRQQLEAAQDDLDDIKSRESKQRVALLDELNTAHSEISSLRSQLRAEQRKKGTLPSA